jgi:cobalt/nickel transport system permease protein
VHIPDGVVFPAVAITGAAVAVAGLGMCVRRTQLDLTGRQLPLAGLTATFFLRADLVHVAS